MFVLSTAMFNTTLEIGKIIQNLYVILYRDNMNESLNISNYIILNNVSYNALSIEAWVK